MISDAQLDDLKARNRCDVVAATYVTLRRFGREKMIGPCPICSTDRHSKTSTKFEASAERWVCANCPDGGDVIELVRKAEKIGFSEAIERLGGTREIDAAAAAEAEAKRKAAAVKAERENGEFRERERVRIYEVWTRADRVVAGTPVEGYLKRRAIMRLPVGCDLRHMADYPYYNGGKRDADVVHRGPAMLAPIVDAGGKFRGLHATWLDLDRPNGKALIRDPQTGDELPAKKVRGSKAGNLIAIAPPARGVAPARLVAGEGIETVLSAWYALDEAGHARADDSFVCAIDLGNLAGRAAATLRHPTARHANGRAQFVAGPSPALDDVKCLPVPASVRELVILADADSDRFVTECAIARAAIRASSAGRLVRVAWPPAGMDFNDVLRAGEAASCQGDA